MENVQTEGCGTFGLNGVDPAKQKQFRYSVPELGLLFWARLAEMRVIYYLLILLSKQY